MAASQEQPDTAGTSVSTAQPSAINKLSKMVSESIADFFGVGENSPLESERWTKRRCRYPQKFGLLKDEYGVQASADEVDATPMRYIRDPLRTGGQRFATMSSTSTFQSHGGHHKPLRTHKPSVVKMTYKGMRRATGSRRKVKPNMSAQSRSFIARGDETPYSAAESSLVDDVFFDETPAADLPKGLHPIQEVGAGDAADTAEAIAALPTGMDIGWRRQPPQALPSTPGEVYDAPDGVGLSKITKKVVKSALEKPAPRRVGMGFVGRLFNRSFRSDRLSSGVKQQIDDMDDHRPYFTYWVTFVQVVVMIVSVSVYGFATPGFTKENHEAQVLKPNLVIETSRHQEPQNFWLGNRQADLIHLGAKYSPCMRRDRHVINALHKNLHLESTSGCCMLGAGTGCFQTLQKHCSINLARFVKGKVCGTDPKECKKPRSEKPFEWGTNITKWPVCVDTPKNSILPWVSCGLTARPCCFGIQGECFVTTREHCEHYRGYYHDDKFLCSQVSCLSQICGMIPFSSPDTPDQFYRLWTSLFLHGGFVHLIITLAFQMLIMRDLEKLAGAIRVAIIYLSSGIAGSLTSAIFLPYQVEVGPAGAQFGILACLMVEIFQSWQLLRRPYRALLIIGGITLVLFAIGFLPWVDNYAHLVGFVFGILLAFALLPYVTFGKFDRRRKLIGIIVCLLTTCGLFALLIILFYVIPIYDCAACQYFNCIPFTEDFCENHDIAIHYIPSYNRLWS